ncbi:MAG: DUF4844 domain-containing protein [Gammaproteobacteria bacterium]|nr:DUF4844 domain-containing protein [Gammaproteobacteria bacterium]
MRIRKYYLSVVLLGSICCLGQISFAQEELVESQIVINIDRAHALQHFISAPKFMADGSYSGVMPDSKRISYEKSINELATRLLARQSSTLSKQDVLNEFKITLHEFDFASSDDKDCLLGYVEKIMDILGIDSSDGLLNTWRYGFDPNKTREEQNTEALRLMTQKELELLAKLKTISNKSALEQLIKILGEPSFNKGAKIYFWFLDDSQQDFISLNINDDQQVIIWESANRFSYTLKI